MKKGVDLFVEELMKSKGKTKHLVFLPIGNKIGEENVIECTFTKDALSARIMDQQDKTDENRKTILQKYKEWKAKKNQE